MNNSMRNILFFGSDVLVLRVLCPETLGS